MTQVLKLDLTSFSRKWLKRLLRTVPTIVTVHPKVGQNARNAQHVGLAQTCSFILYQSVQCAQWSLISKRKWKTY